MQQLGLLHLREFRDTSKNKCYFYFNTFENVIYSCDAKLIFSSHYSSLQCHMILQKSF